MAFFFLFIAYANAYEFPPYEGLSLKVEGQVAESYSNNITYASKSEDKVEDLLTNITLGAGLKSEGIRRSLELRGQLNWQMITETGSLENSSERVTAIFSNEFTKYDRIMISNTYNHTEVPGTVDEGLNLEQCQNLFDLFGRDKVMKLYPECSQFEEQFGRTTGKFDSYSNTVNFTYNRDFGERFNTNAGYIFSKDWSPEVGTTDSDQNIFRFGANYGLSAATIFSFAYSYENTRYDSGSDIDIQRVSGGIRYYITKRLYVQGRAGMDFSSTNDDSPDIEASLSGDIDDKTSTIITYARSVDASSNNNDVFRSWRVSGDVSRALSEDLDVSLTGFYGEGDFVSQDITDTFTGMAFNINYNFWKDKLGKSVDGRFGYTYSNLASTDDERDYSRIGLDAGLSVSF